MFLLCAFSLPFGVLFCKEVHQVIAQIFNKTSDNGTSNKASCGSYGNSLKPSYCASCGSPAYSTGSGDDERAANSSDKASPSASNDATNETPNSPYNSPTNSGPRLALSHSGQ